MSNKINNLIQFENYKLDLERKTLWFEDENLDLPLKAIEVLCVLAENPGRLISKDEIFDKVWSDSFVEDSVLSQNIYLLRKTFDKFGSDKDLIRTVPRRGYRFRGEVSEILEETIFEHETFEREIYLNKNGFAENGSNDPINPDTEAVQKSTAPVAESPAEQGNSLSSRKLLVYPAAILTLLFVGFFGWFYVFPYFENTNTGSKLNASNLVYDRITESSRSFQIGLSRDNQNAVYVSHTADNLYKVTMQHLPTGSETIVIPPQKNRPNWLTFSPDGHYVYYTSKDDLQKNSIFRVPIYGGRTEKIAEGLSSFFSISPDGSQLAYVLNEPDKDATHLVVANILDGSSERKVKTLQGNRVFAVWGISPAWRPDGRKIVMTTLTQEKTGDEFSKKPELVEVDVVDGTVKPVKTPEWDSFGKPFWQRDGKGLFLLAGEGNGKPDQIWHLGYPDGKAKKITNDTNHYYDFRPASDGSFFLTTTLTRSINLFLMPLDDPSNLKQLTFDTDIMNGVFGLEWSSDGKYVVFNRANRDHTGQLWRINTETLEKQQLTFDENATIRYADLTRDGKSLVFGSNRTGKHHIWKMDLDGNNLKQITDGISEANPLISADGKWLYYISPADIPKALWKMPLDGNGKPVEVLKNVAGKSIISPADPKKIASYYYDPNDKDKNPWKYILFDEDHSENWKDLKTPILDWASDGSGIYFLDKGESFNNIWFVSTQTSEKKQITDFKDMKFNDLVISPDGKTAVVTRGATVGSVIKITAF
ncbi:MAG: winged helix-turn-helix domain-containing protein [Pyrinomonadaceae bacterium]